MRELHGVAWWYGLNGPAAVGLKQKALLFDKVHIIGLSMMERQLQPHHFAQDMLAEIEFLKAHNFLGDIDGRKQRKNEGGLMYEGMVPRELSSRLSNGHRDCTPVYDASLAKWCEVRLKHTAIVSDDVFSVAVNAMPVPGEETAWDEILDFRSECHDKHWGFRRWLHSISTRNLTEAEVKDEIEWSLNEYAKAMAIHKIKAAQSFVDVFVISPFEIIENLVRFNWSKIAKGMLSVKKRKIELMEAEMKSPGRECAYVFDARKRFG